MKKLIVSLIILILPLFFPTKTYSQNNFKTRLRAIYTATESENLNASLKFEITNLTTDKYTKSFTLVLENVNLQNPKAIIDNTEIPIEINKKDNQKTIKVTFPKKSVGKGNTQNFEIQFSDNTLVAKIGEVWEISLPKISSADQFDELLVELRVPKSFGDLAALSPPASEKHTTPSSQIFLFYKDALTDKAISASFGHFQVFSFDLSYHLENPLSNKAETSIAIPPDTAFQKMFYSSLDPTPTSINRDEDGNWIASYALDPKQKLDIKAKGHIQVFAKPRSLPLQNAGTLQKNTLSTPIWQTQNPKIQATASSLEDIKEIYDFVVNRLTYNYDRLKPNTKRLGAAEALLNPTEATCMEFTDLFIALARAKGIPAREINGFAYTENPRLKPLSLVADVLHAWPEYWDEEKNIWIPVDPTWESTTGGSDYFNTFDLKHITFAIHGINSQKPYPAGSYKLGPNPQKDVYINLSSLPEEKIPNITLKTQQASKIPIGNTKFTLYIKSNGPSALYNQNLNIYFDQRQKDKIAIESLLPMQTFKYSFTVPYGLTGKKAPGEIRLEYAKEVLVISTNKNYTTLIAATAALSSILLASITIFFKLHK